jgi:transposase
MEEDPMTRRQQDPLRSLTVDEWRTLEHVVRRGSERADHVARAKALLAVAGGASYTAAAQAAGRRSGDAVAQLVSRFNQEGLAALEVRHGGGPAVQYGVAERERILTEFRRTPDREQDGTASWSLSTLQRTLRRAPDGLPQVSTATMLQVLWQAGYSWQRDRTWWSTGTALRKRTAGVVTVVDPDATAKNSCSSGPTGWGNSWGWPSGVRMKLAPTRRCPIPVTGGNPKAGRGVSRTSRCGRGPPSC